MFLTLKTVVLQQVFLGKTPLGHGCTIFLIDLIKHGDL